MEDPGGSGFSHFLNTATAIGVLFVGVMTVKYGDSLIPDSLIETIPQGAVLPSACWRRLPVCAWGFSSGESSGWPEP